MLLVCFSKLGSTNLARPGSSSPALRHRCTRRICHGNRPLGTVLGGWRLDRLQIMFELLSWYRFKSISTREKSEPLASDLKDGTCQHFRSHVVLCTSVQSVRAVSVSWVPPIWLHQALYRQPTLEATQGQILSQSPTDATSGR